MPEAPLRRLLIVSPHFPPLNAPDLQRVRMSLPFYRACGWEPIVLTVADERQVGVREPELIGTYPADIRVERCRAFSVRWTRFLGIGNLGLRCWLPMLLAGARLIRRERIDLVFFSTTQFFTFTLGRIWRACHGTPYLFDVQDPWRTDHYERPGSRPPPGGWKYRFARLVAWALEGWSYRRVAAVMSVSPRYLDDLRARYAPLRAAPCATIRFGASVADLAVARALPAPAYQLARSQGEIHFLYTGAAGPVTPHALTVLFEGLRRYRAAQPARAARFRLHFLGTSYVAPGAGCPAVLPLAAACGVADLVAEIPHRLGHLECLRLQSEADVLLLPGSSDLSYSPSKTFPYFLTGRPMLGLVFRDSVLEELLEQLGGAVLVRFREHEPKDDAYAALARFFDLAATGFATAAMPPRREETFRSDYLAESLTREQAALFEAALAYAAKGTAR